VRYPSDLADEEWALVQPEIPRAKRGGNKRTVDVREVVNGLMYVLSTGCQWRAIPKDLPPRSTVNHYFCRWQHDGTLNQLHHALYGAAANRPVARPVRRRRSSTLRASRARKRGALDRSAGL
jgi:transposase